MAGKKGSRAEGSRAELVLTTDFVSKATYRLGAAALAAGAVMLLYDPVHAYPILTAGAAAIGARLGGHLDNFLDRPRSSRKKRLKGRALKELPAKTDEGELPANTDEGDQEA